jgi:hypothetical protein
VSLVVLMPCDFAMFVHTEIAMTNFTIINYRTLQFYFYVGRGKSLFCLTVVDRHLLSHSILRTGIVYTLPCKGNNVSMHGLIT